MRCSTSSDIAEILSEKKVPEDLGLSEWLTSPSFFLGSGRVKRPVSGWYVHNTSRP